MKEVFMRRRLLTILVAAAAAVAATVAAPAGRAEPDQYCGPAGTTASASVDTGLQELFRAYGDDPEPGHWTGADTTNSVLLPDGRDIWIFSDTFLGKVNPDETRAPWPETPLVNNSDVLMDHGKLKRTLVGGTLTNPAALVAPADPTHWFWQGDGTVEGDHLRVFVEEWEHTGTGIFDFAPVGDRIASFSLPDLHLESVVDAPSEVAGGPVYWGAGIMEDGPWTYVYGSEDHGADKYAHVARVPAGHLLDFAQWRYWTGSGWSSDAMQSQRLLDGIENEYSVTHVSTGYMLVTMDGSTFFGNTIYAYFSCSPTGPFGDATPLYAAPGVGTRGFLFVYNAHLHPELTEGNSFLVTYNENSFTAQDLYDDVNVYRPKFIRFSIPGVMPLG
jgi:hypothetical protein